MPEQFEQIYRVYFTPVYRYLLKLCHDPDIAEEITAQTFFKALNAFKSFKGQSKIDTWLCQIGRNCYFDFLKYHGRTLEIQQIMDSESNSPPLDESLLETEAITDIQTAIQQIPSPYREVFLLRLQSELSFREISEIYRRSDNWACVTYYRAKHMIKQKMEVL